MIYPSFVHFTSLLHKIVDRDIVCRTEKKGVPSVESSRSVRGLGKGVSGKSYPRLCNARSPMQNAKKNLNCDADCNFFTQIYG